MPGSRWPATTRPMPSSIQTPWRASFSGSARMPNERGAVSQSRGGAGLEWYSSARLELEAENHRYVGRLVVREAERSLRVDADVSRFEEHRRSAEAEVEAGPAIVTDVGLRVLDRLGAVAANLARRVSGNPVRAGSAHEIEAARRAEQRYVQLQATAAGVDRDIA